MYANTNLKLSVPETLSKVQLIEPMSIFYSSTDYASMTWIVKMNLNNFLCNSHFNCVCICFSMHGCVQFFLSIWRWFYLFPAFVVCEPDSAFLGSQVDSDDFQLLPISIALLCYSNIFLRIMFTLYVQSNKYYITVHRMQPCH